MELRVQRARPTFGIEYALNVPVWQRIVNPDQKKLVDPELLSLQPTDRKTTILLERYVLTPDDLIL